jgi:hypothetical protein
MAGDLASDLELDQESAYLTSKIPGELSSAQLDQLRAYLAYHYALSKYVLNEAHQNQHTHARQLHVHIQYGAPGSCVDTLDREMLRSSAATC